MGDGARKDPVSSIGNIFPMSGTQIPPAADQLLHMLGRARDYGALYGADPNAGGSEAAVTVALRNSGFSRHPRILVRAFRDGYRDAVAERGK